MLVRKELLSPEWSAAVFAAIDIAVRPGVLFHHGPGGNFSAGTGEFSNRGGKGVKSPVDDVVYD